MVGDPLFDLSEDRFAFDQYNAEFMRTRVISRLAPPAMFADGWVRCLPEEQRYRKSGTWYKRTVVAET